MKDVCSQNEALAGALDWLIIGGGIHGVHIAARLIGEAGIAPDRLRIVDPADRLLSHWRTSTATTGMTHLRSPSVHHLDLSPWALRRFADEWKSSNSERFATPYNRPALDLFNAHCDQVVKTFGLAERHIKDRVTSCLVDRDGVVVRLSGEGELAARHIVLPSARPSNPSGQSGRLGTTNAYTTSSNRASTGGRPSPPRPSPWSEAASLPSRLPCASTTKGARFTSSRATPCVNTSSTAILAGWARSS